jgi:hypothetical protein
VGHQQFGQLRRVPQDVNAHRAEPQNEEGLVRQQQQRLRPEERQRDARAQHADRGQDDHWAEQP